MYHILDWIYFFSGHELFNFIFVKTDGGFSDFSFQRIGIFGFAGLAKFFSSAFRFLHCTFWWLVQFAGFLQFSLWFSGFWQKWWRLFEFSCAVQLTVFLCQGRPSPDVVLLLLLCPTKFRNQVLRDFGTVVSFAAVIKSSPNVGEKRCVTTLITAAKERYGTGTEGDYW